MKKTLKRGVVIFLHSLLAAFIVTILISIILSLATALHANSSPIKIHGLIDALQKFRLWFTLLYLIAITKGIHHGVNSAYRSNTVDKKEIAQIPWLVFSPYFLIWLISALNASSLFAAVPGIVIAIAAFAASRYFLQRRFRGQHQVT